MSKQIFNNIREYEMEQFSLEDIHKRKTKQEITNHYDSYHSNNFRANDNSNNNLESKHNGK